MTNLKLVQQLQRQLAEPLCLSSHTPVAACCEFWTCRPAEPAAKENANTEKTIKHLGREACQPCCEPWLKRGLGGTEGVPALRTADLGVVSIKLSQAAQKVPLLNTMISTTSSGNSEDNACIQLQTFTLCLFLAPVKSRRTSLPGEVRLAPHAPSPGWHALLLLLLLLTTKQVSVLPVACRVVSQHANCSACQLHMLISSACWQPQWSAVIHRSHTAIWHTWMLQMEPLSPQSRCSNHRRNEKVVLNSRSNGLAVKPLNPQSSYKTDETVLLKAEATAWQCANCPARTTWCRTSFRRSCRPSY